MSFEIEPIDPVIRAIIATCENGLCQNLRSEHTITPVDSEAYDSIAGHKHSLDQDTCNRTQTNIV